MLTVAWCLLAGLLCGTVSAAPYYEMSAPYRFSTGGATFRGSVDVATGALLIRAPIATIFSRVPITAAWLYNSQDASDGPLG
jgi:hypothetical protein